MKTCTRCGETKPLDGGFHRNKNNRDGREARCKTCRRAQQSEYRARPEVRAHRAEYNARPEVKARMAEYNAEYYEANRDKILAHQVAYRVEYYARPEVKARKAEYNVEYRAQNGDRLREWEREYRARPEVKARAAESRAEYNARPDVKARKAEYWAEYKAVSPHVSWESRYRRRAKRYGFEPVVESFTKDELIARWGDACWHCGGPFEQLDHYVTPVALGGHHTLENCRPSCAPCNTKGSGIRRTNTNETENTK